MSSGLTVGEVGRRRGCRRSAASHRGRLRRRGLSALPRRSPAPALAPPLGAPASCRQCRARAGPPLRLQRRATTTTRRPQSRVARMRNLQPALAGDHRPRLAPDANRRFFLWNAAVVTPRPRASQAGESRVLASHALLGPDAPRTWSGDATTAARAPAPIPSPVAADIVSNSTPRSANARRCTSIFVRCRRVDLVQHDDLRLVGEVRGVARKLGVDHVEVVQRRCARARS